MKNRSIAVASVAVTFSTVLTPCVAWAGAPYQDELGYLDLIERLGGNAPDGTGILAGHVEAGSSYAPDMNHAEFNGKTFTLKSGASGTSNHATRVGRNFYGLTSSVAAGIADIHLYSANGWLQNDFLRVGPGSTPPITVPVDIFNCSWIGTFQNNDADNNALRRADFAIDSQDLVMAVGVNNGSGPLDVNDTLMSHAFNVISVGRTTGNHHHGTTRAGIDGPGRMRPDIVAPDTATSWSTGLISGCVAVLQETAASLPGLQGNPNADDAEVIKAVLLAGAQHRPGWTNNPATSGSNRGVTATPYDETYGVDVANVNSSHLIFTGLEHDGATTPPTGGSVPASGWDLFPINSNQSRHWRFQLADVKDEVSMLVTWHRRTSSDFSTSDLPNLDLELFAVDGGGNLVSLRGNAGLSAFIEGNIASVSDVDNVEHLYIKGLAAGNYILRVKRSADSLDSWVGAVAWTMPPDDVVNATLTSFIMVRGSVVSGGIPQLITSDNEFLRTQSQFGFLSTEPNITEVSFNFNTTADSPSAVTFTIESRLNNPNGNVKVRARNYNTNRFDTVREYILGTTETTEVVSGLSGSNYVDTDGDSEFKVKQVVIATFSVSGFQSYFDLVQLGVTQ
ncbi:MAG: hypothetical protein ACR2GY_01905 [Phycisphaerales bacterium]